MGQGYEIKLSIKISAGALILLILPIISILAQTSSTVNPNNTTVNDLNDELRTIKDKIKTLEKQKEEYQEKIKEIRSEGLTIQREINFLENRIAQTEIEIITEQARIDQTNLEIRGIDEEIVKTEKEILIKKEQLSLLISKLDKTGEIDYLNILLFEENFSSFFDAIRDLESMQTDVYQAVENIKKEKILLENQKTALIEKKQYRERLKDSLLAKKEELESQQETKAYLLSETRLSERKFQGLIAQIKQEQDNANAEILSLEKDIREALSKQQLLDSLGRDEEFFWPIASRTITAYFHDADYPFRYIFEHPAIDIATTQGTPIRATKSGYVGRAKDAGLGYSYILIVHDDGLSSVYGHVSKISVKEEDFVVQGQIIGLSGGKPGTLGAGNLSTGAHLHFEIRKDGIPIDPLNYLP